jgi:hypothetical protein
MNAGIQASNIDSAVPIQVLFKAGQFVRIKGGKTVGRVVEDTPDENSSTRVQVFDDDSWGTSPSFSPGALTMWTPDEVRRVPAPKPEPTPPTPLMDVVFAEQVAMRASALIDLLNELGAAEGNNGKGAGSPGHLLAQHAVLIASLLDETNDDLLEIIATEAYRQREAAKPRKKN